MTKKRTGTIRKNFLEQSVARNFLIFFGLPKLVGSAFPKLDPGKVVKTKISPLLKPLNKDVGLVVLGWGTTPLMVVILALFLVFLLILVNIYNTSLVLEGLDVDWQEFI